MLIRAVNKELLNYLLDGRFVAVFALCSGLSALSVYVGSQNYRQRLSDHQVTPKAHQEHLQINIDPGDIYRLRKFGYHWLRRPEVLSPVVYGLSGQLGQEIQLNADRAPKFEASVF